MARRQVKYNPDYHDDWAWSLAVKGATDQEIADAFGVSRQTILRWSKTKNGEGEVVLSPFGEALKMGKEAADAKVERKLFERCMGLETQEVRKILDYDAQGKPVVKKSEVISREIPPDAVAIFYWLNNRKKNTGEWAQRQKVALDTDEMAISKLEELLRKVKDDSDR